MTLDQNQSDSAKPSAAVLSHLKKPVAFIGMMGAGKSAIGKLVAARLGLSFVDADKEIEKAAAATIEEIFEKHGEGHFRDGERRVIARLIGDGPMILATGGGAYMDPDTRALLHDQAITVWLRADFDVLWRRVSRRAHRPLLKTADPQGTLSRLMDDRYPTYELADLIVDSDDAPKDETANRVVDALMAYLSGDATDPSSDRLTVDLADRSYEILVGENLIETAGRYIEPVLKRKQVVIVTDETVAALHLDRLKVSLDRSDIAHDAVILPSGEKTKSFDHLGKLMDRLFEIGIERATTLIAFGGGVIGDLTGFAAASALRGIDFIQIPTTLLAQVDSSVGGKTGINVAAGKNLVGAFHQPRLVLADTGVLDTLPRRELLAGYAEVVKYGAIDDTDFFDWLEVHGRDLIEGDRDARRHAVLTSCAAKARIVAEDERESGRRALLNLGHTFGHALESAVGYGDRLLHGEAVSIGMIQAFALSRRMGLAPGQDVERLKRHLENVGLKTGLADIPGMDWRTDDLIGRMATDKKVADGKLTFILARGLGEAFVTRDVSPEDLAWTLDTAIEEAAAVKGADG